MTFFKLDIFWLLRVQRGVEGYLLKVFIHYTRIMDGSRTKFETILEHDICTNLNYASLFKNTQDIKEVVRYAMADGQRIRAIIIGGLSAWQNPSFMLFIEYVHTASLIIDDLPCMDNDILRRGKETLHIKYGEHIAQLTAYNLTLTGLVHLNQGLDLVKNQNLYSADDYDRNMGRIRSSIYSKLGFQGICGGQYLDLLIGAKTESIDNMSERERKALILKLINMKTGDLFSISFLLGWIGRGGEVKHFSAVEHAGQMLGICYQIIDDLEDYTADCAKNRHYNNICHYYTFNELVDLFTEKINVFAKTGAQLKLLTVEILSLYKLFLEKFTRALKFLQKPLVYPSPHDTET